MNTNIKYVPVLPIVFEIAPKILSVLFIVASADYSYSIIFYHKKRR